MKKKLFRWRYKKFFIISIIIDIFLFFDIPILISQVEEYFPMQIGNYWTYDEISDMHLLGQLTISIIDTISIEGKKYFLFDHFFYARELKDSALFYIDGQNVVRRVDDEDQVWFDFGANLYTKWNIEVFDADLDTIVQIEVSLFSKSYKATINGRYCEDCYIFYFNNLFATEHDWVYTFARGIGCIELGLGTSVPGYYKFRCGVIDDVEYPDLITMTPERKDNLKGKSETSKIIGAYPNPFNSSIRIEMLMNNVLNEDVVIKIFDTLGKLVKTFPTNYETNGFIVFNWDAKSDDGKNISSGLYFIVLDTAENILSTKKVMYLK